MRVLDTVSNSNESEEEEEEEEEKEAEETKTVNKKLEEEEETNIGAFVFLLSAILSKLGRVIINKLSIKLHQITKKLLQNHSSCISIHKHSLTILHFLLLSKTQNQW